MSASTYRRKGTGLLSVDPSHRQLNLASTRAGSAQTAMSWCSSTGLIAKAEHEAIVPCERIDRPPPLEC